jgi:predicted nucleic acid-binding protein
MEYVHTIKFFFFDASILVKLVVDEPGSKKVRDLLGNGTCQTTQMCLHEAYGVTKRKWKKKEIDDEKYLHAMYMLSSLVRDNMVRLVENSLENIDDFGDAKRLVAQYTNQIDLSDALQIISMKKGFYSLLGGESQPVLITADKNLGKVAGDVGLKVTVI